MNKIFSFTNKQLLKTINFTQKCPILPEITNHFDKNFKKLIFLRNPRTENGQNKFFGIFVKIIGNFRQNRAFLCKVYSFQQLLVSKRKKIVHKFNDFSQSRGLKNL